MISQIVSTLLALVFSLAMAQSANPEQVELKVKSDLDSMISKMLEPNSYSLQVSAAFDKVNERQLVEGEQITQSQTAKKIEVPPLPGFDPEPLPPADNNPGQTRQVFRTVEKPVLRSIAVSLLLDQSIAEDQRHSVEDIVRSYLSSYGSLAHLTVQRAALRPLEKKNSWLGMADLNPAVGIALLVLGFAAIAALVMLTRIASGLRRFNADSSAVYRSVGPLGGEQAEPIEIANRFKALSAPDEPRDLLSLKPAQEKKERAAFSGVPTNSQYADGRRLLLDAFLQNATEFRLYFAKLEPFAKLELSSALSGPAFETLVESLKLEIDRNETAPPPSEEQLQFYLKNFSEFQEALRWQEKQFFGFLPHLNEEQILALVQSQSPVVAALILKFTNVACSAAILERLNDQQRAGIIDQFERTREMSPEELTAIESSVRSSVRILPNFILGTTRKEVEYWQKILGASSEPHKLLTSLEGARPDLYQHLARFRFKLEDLASLPPTLLKQVMDDFENDDLARAMSTQPAPLIEYALGELPEARRRLLSGQIKSFQNVQNAEVDRSVHLLTQRFREVLA